MSETALSKECEIVINLCEPHHHELNAEVLKKALHRNAPVDEMLNVLCFPILLIYDSDALASGWLPIGRLVLVVPYFRSPCSTEPLQRTVT
ncbi:DUF1837 domain-containing protein [Pseudomonas sp. PDM05]|uniref:Hachiman antiphage defense system protein HamA n=1 Tax=Pseudomonas sp. PDM05 TaxID=2769301 RepID=UPI0017867DA3|nr:Hachiman antiphage defense system protein HamA [Pseudomonas sp. PDM05]MBD9459437.1 DUF1837 domain-containing protein [Pseudomonas sp. PDM05]